MMDWMELMVMRVTQEYRVSQEKMVKMESQEQMVPKAYQDLME